MNVVFFSSQSYDRQSFTACNTHYQHDLHFLEVSLNAETAVLAAGYPVVCLFVNDQADAPTLTRLWDQGTRLLALRCAGFNMVDLDCAHRLGLKLVRVPAYSPYAVAELAVGLILNLNRKLHKAYNRVRDDNFSLEGLIGFDLHGCQVGVVGTGKIGLAFAQIMAGFGCPLLGYDTYPNPQFEQFSRARYVDLPELLAAADIISLHCPLLPATHHLINGATIAQMKPGVMLINTSRGGLIDTAAVIDGIKAGQIGYLGIDVYEREDELFFQDLSATIIQDDIFQLLQSFPNVIITAHQGFLTRNALANIATTTLESITAFSRGQPLPNQVPYSVPVQA